MTVHIIHKSIKDSGLADGCARCSEIAKNPFAGLDNGNLSNLYHRTNAGDRGRTTNERVAMQVMMKAILNAQAIERLK